jgi:hypothetical protein
MQTEANTELVAELAVNATLVKLAINLAAELVAQNDGSMGHLRALLSTALPGEALGPAIPPIVPAAGQGHDATAALALANDKAAKTMQFIADQAATAVVKQGITLKRE